MTLLEKLLTTQKEKLSAELAEVKAERDALQRENEKMRFCNMSGDDVCLPVQELNELRARIGSAHIKLQEAFDYAAHRWSEWGSRAEEVAGLLDELEKILRDESEG